jgi:hypothetical protein
MYKLFDYYFDVCINIAYFISFKIGPIYVPALVHTDYRIAAGDGRDALAISDTEVNGVAPEIKAILRSLLSIRRK